jgi:hypothetical protein
LSPFPCRLDDQPVTITIEPTSIVADGRSIPYVDVDGVRVDGHTITFDMADGSTKAVTQLGRQHEDFVLELDKAWRHARRAALLQWTGDAPIDEYDGRNGEAPVKVVLFGDGVTVEGHTGAPAMAPFALIDRVERDNYTITLSLRAGLDAVVIRQLGRRTEEFLLDLDKARSALVARTVAAYEDFSHDLAGFAAPDGWAVDRAGAGVYWNALRAAVAGQERGPEVDHLESLAGGALRLGIKANFAGAALPFALATANGKTAVEGTAEGEARATFVFATDDVDRLNAVLLLTSFRREAISFPEDQLGRWAVAVRLLELLRWARAALVDRVVHDATWTDKITQALSG